MTNTVRLHSLRFKKSERLVDCTSCPELLIMSDKWELKELATSSCHHKVGLLADVRSTLTCITLLRLSRRVLLLIPAGLIPSLTTSLPHWLLTPLLPTDWNSALLSSITDESIYVDPSVEESHRSSLLCNAVNHRRMSRANARKRKLKVQLHFSKRQSVLFFAVVLSSKYKEGIPVAVVAELKHRAGARSTSLCSFAFSPGNVPKWTAVDL